RSDGGPGRIRGAAAGRRAVSGGGPPDRRLTRAVRWCQITRRFSYRSSFPRECSRVITLRPLTSSLWLIAVLRSIARSAQYAPSLFAELHWRPIGPFRRRRTLSATGRPGPSP